MVEHDIEADQPARLVVRSKWTVAQVEPANQFTECRSRSMEYLSLLSSSSGDDFVRSLAIPETVRKERSDFADATARRHDDEILKIVFQ